jgi:hypothetical protein
MQVLDEEHYLKRVDELVGGFSRELTEAGGSTEALRRSGEVIAESMLEWKWRYSDQEPGRWTVADLEGYLLEFFPRQMPSEGELIADAPDCAAAFLRFLDRAGCPSGDSADALANRCEAIRAEFAAAATDRSRWGLAKTFAAQMQAEGADPSDPVAFQQWVADFNSRPFEERDRIIGPALAGAREAAASDLDAGADPFAAYRIDEAELDEIEAQLEAETRHARETLEAALADELLQPAPKAEVAAAAARIRSGLKAGGYPFDWIGRATGLRSGEPRADGELIVGCVAATISPAEETGLDIEEEATIMSLENADWLGAVVATVRTGVGAAADPASLVVAIHACEEVELADDFDPETDQAVETAFTIISPAWEALGVIDGDSRLTPLGAWALPRALALVGGQ